MIGENRTGVRYQSIRSEKDKALNTALLSKATQCYLMLHGLLKRDSVVINRKRSYRLYTERALQVRTKKRKKLIRPRVPLIVPQSANQRWSMDFVHDQLAPGRRFRVLNVVDVYTRECVGLLVEYSISGQRVARFLRELMEQRGKPKSITCDNGTEYTSKAMFFWSREHKARLNFIQPGKLTQNDFVESFNGKFRDNCLNQQWFRTIEEALSLIEDWRIDYNEISPPSSLNYQPPSVFARAVA